MKKNADGYYRETFTFKGRRYDVTAKTERELWRKVDEKKRRLEEGVDVVNENTSVDKWFFKYLETYKKRQRLRQDLPSARGLRQELYLSCNRKSPLKGRADNPLADDNERVRR